MQSCGKGEAGPPTADCLLTTRVGGGYKTSHPVQGETAVVTDLFFQKLCTEGTFYPVQIYTKHTDIQVRIYLKWK